MQASWLPLHGREGTVGCKKQGLRNRCRGLTGGEAVPHFAAAAEVLDADLEVAAGAAAVANAAGQGLGRVVMEQERGSLREETVDVASERRVAVKSLRQM